MSSDFYDVYILPYAGIIIKLCRAYTDDQESFEDYYQEVCLQIWKSRTRFQAQAQWSTWIYRIALNVCLTLMKKDIKRSQVFTSAEQASLTCAYEQTFANENINILYDAIKQLSEIERGIILLYLEERTYEEIAEITGASVSNVGVRINRIKKRLKTMIHDKIN